MTQAAIIGAGDLGGAIAQALAEAMIVGAFQERYPQGVSFGHAAAMIRGESESATDKKKLLADCSILIADTLEDVPWLLREAMT